MTLQEMIQEARMLSLEERKQLIKLLVDMVTEPQEQPLHKERSLMELAGLGKEIWQGIDAQEYVNQQRDEWNHRL